MCPGCLAVLVDDADATITCGQCRHVCPARMQACPSCFALLRAEDRSLEVALGLSVTAGVALPRPLGRPSFADGPACTIERVGGTGGLVLRGLDGFVEARLGPGRVARAPLVCHGEAGVLFRMVRYEAAERSVVAIAPDGAAMATFLHDGALLCPGLEVRDETSAPVARLELEDDLVYRLVETGGGVVGRVDQQWVDVDGWVDDRWSVAPESPGGHPLRPLVWVALVVASKVLLGTPMPTRSVSLVDVVDAVDKVMPPRLADLMDPDRYRA